MIQRLAAVIFIVLAVPPAAMANPGSLSPASGKPILGYLDPKTDKFTPLSPPEAERSAAGVSPDAAAATIVRSGTLVVTGNIAIDPSVSASTTFFANVQATAGDTKYSNVVGVSGSVTRSGRTGKVTLKMPYAFTVSSTADVVMISFEVFSSAGETINVTENIPLPANGATTNVAIGEKA